MGRGKEKKLVMYVELISKLVFVLVGSDRPVREI